MERYRELKSRIRQTCKQRRIRLEEFMRPYDVHNNRGISVYQFNRALDLAGLQLSPEEIQLLVLKFRHSSDPLLMDHQKFCNQMDKIFTIKGLESNPLATPVKLLEDTTSNLLLNELENEEWRILKEKLGTAVQVKGLSLRDLFQPLDPKNTGYVAKYQFMKHIGNLCTLSPNELDLIVRVHGNDDVHYRALHREITSNNKIHPTPTSHTLTSLTSSSKPQTNHHQLDLVYLEQKLSKIILQKRIRLKNFFIDFDSRKTGKCTLAQFKRGLKLCFPFLQENEMEQLAENYQIGNNSVKYMEFANKLASSAEGDGAASSYDFQNVKNIKEKCDDPNPTFVSMMNHMNHLYSTKRILVKPLFQDFDQRREGHVTIPQFFRVLTMFNLQPSLEQHKLLLLEKYSSEEGAFVNYLQFCKDLEEFNLPYSTTAADLTAREQVTTTTSLTTAHENSYHQEGFQKSRTLSMLIRYIKEKLHRDRIPLEEFFKDYDPLRKGRITVSQFSNGMGLAGFIINQHELQLLANVFQSPELDRQQNTMFLWTKFTDEMNALYFSTKHLEKKPLGYMISTQIKGENVWNDAGNDAGKNAGKNAEHLDIDAETIWNDKNNSLSEQEDVQLQTILAHMSKIIMEKRIDLKPMCSDFDVSHRGHIPSSKLERVLSVFHLLPNPKEFQLIIKKFSTNLQHPDVNYNAFLEALETHFTTRFHISQPTSINTTNKTNKRATTLQRSSFSSKHDLGIESILQYLHQQIVQKRIRLKDFVTEPDRLRSGEITIPKFLSALSATGISLEKDEILCLQTTFQSLKNQDKIDWRKFMEAIESLRNTSSSDFSDTFTPTIGQVTTFSFDKTTSTPTSSSTPTTSSILRDEGFHHDQVKEILEKIKLVVSQRRLLLKPYFQDYDKNRHHRVTKTQFEAVLDRMQLRLLPQEVQRLAQHFAIQNPRVPTSDVNYYDFIQQVN